MDTALLVLEKNLKGNIEKKSKGMMRKIIGITLILSMLFSLLLGIPQTAIAGNGLEVVCVPWRGDENLPHPTYEGKEITLKGTVKYDGTLTWEWDFGDGTKVTGTDTATDDYPYPISARHTYTGIVGTLYVAKLTVTAGGETKSDTYLVKIEEKTRKVEADVAVDEGLWWLYQQQNRYALDGVNFGYWGWGFKVAHTSAAVQAFENNFHKPFGDPTKDPYVDCVRRGLNYLISQMYKVDIPTDDGDTNGNGFGIACHDPAHSNYEMYEIGMAMMAIVSSDTPSRVAVAGTDGVIGRTYREIVQDMADFCAYAQNGPETGFYEGGWRYYRNYGVSDNSVTQWPIMGMEPAEKKWGIKIADFVKPRLEGWLSRTQSITGGFGYTYSEDWVNIAKTAGTGIPGLLFCGVPETDSRVVNAINFIDNNWYSDNFGNGYAMYAVMKAFEEFLHRESTGTHTWWDEYVDYLIPLQYADGYWDTMSYSYSPQLTTAWMVMILTKVVYDIPPTAVAKANGFDEVEVDKNQIVNFDASQSREGTYKIMKYEWDFESDGVYDAEGLTASHSYNEYGTYTVTLRVTDNRDIVTGGRNPAMSDTDTCVIRVHPPPHPPIADANGPYLGWVGVPVTLDGSGSWDPNQPPFGADEIISYDWDLDNDGEFDDASGKMVEFTWNEPGIYSIALRVRAKEEPYDCEEPSRTLVKIGNHDPVADINGPYETMPGFLFRITLDGSGSYDPDEPFGDRIVSYDWDLDNDGEFDDASGVYTEFWGSEGIYTVRLRVTDSFGASDTDWTIVIVKKVEPEWWSFAIITDLHIGWCSADYGEEGYCDKSPGQNYWLTDRLKEIINEINLMKDIYNIHFVVVLGDMADSGEYSELLKAREILAGLNDPNGDGNTADGIPYIPVIGNHDVFPYTQKDSPFLHDNRVTTIDEYWKEGDFADDYFNEVFWKENVKNVQKIYEVFGDSWKKQYDYSHTLQDTGQIALLQNYVFSYRGVKFLCLDFVNRELESFLNKPRLFTETKKWLSENLNLEVKAGEKAKSIILFSHHPLVSELWQIGDAIHSGIPVTANFAGHVHDNDEKLLTWLFWDYAVSMKVITTEAVCRESTWWDSDAWSSNNIRIVRIENGQIKDYDMLFSIHDETKLFSRRFFKLKSPADLIVSDPEGVVITKDTGEVPGMSYMESDLNGDGKLEDIIFLEELKKGDYHINVVPEPDASPTDTYTLEFVELDVINVLTIPIAENVQISDIPLLPYLLRSTETEIIPIIPASVDFDPDTLNLDSKEKWVTVFIELPLGHGYDVSMMDASSIILNGQIQAYVKFFNIDDYDNDGIPDLMVKFSKEDASKILLVGERVEIIISGKLLDGRLFEGKDIIKVIARK